MNCFENVCTSQDYLDRQKSSRNGQTLWIRSFEKSEIAARKKAIDYAIDKLITMIRKVGSQAIDQLSIKIRPKKNYKTNRRDSDGSNIIYIIKIYAQCNLQR